MTDGGVFLKKISPLFRSGEGEKVYSLED